MTDKFILLKMSDSDAYIIGKIQNETDEEIILYYPLTIRLAPNGNGTTSVSTSKTMPFSTNNLVAIIKDKITAISSPNKRVIGYYLHVLDKYGELYDEDMENDILGIRNQKEVKVAEEDVLETNDIPTGSNTVH